MDHGFGYRKSTRRPSLGVLRVPSVTLPTSVDLRDRLLLPVPDQGQFGTCTANGGAAMFEYELLRQGVAVPHRKSRAFLYYTSGVLEGDVADDGRDPHYTFLALQLDGLCDEEYWVYDEAHITHKPSPAAYRAAAHRHGLLWHVVPQSLAAVQGALAAGFVVGVAFAVYDGYESPVHGVVPLPIDVGPPLGWHWNVIVGYSNVDGQRCPKDHLIVRNSWGEGWGDVGHGYLPNDYLTASLPGAGGPLVVDLMVLEKVSQ